jgi:hypothetical protein
MIRPFAKWLISRSIDQGRPLPKWLESLVARDESLRRFHQQAIRLEGRLRDEAGHWAEGNKSQRHQAITAGWVQPNSDRVRMAADQSPPPRSRAAGPWSILPATAATIFLVAIGAWIYRSGEQVQGQATLAQGNSAVVNDALLNKNDPATEESRKALLLATLRSTSQAIRSFKPVIDDTTASKLMGPMDWSSSQWSLSKTIDQSTDFAGAKTGQVLMQLNDGMESEHQQILNDLKRATNYFSSTLPKRAGKLVGLNLRTSPE